MPEEYISAKKLGDREKRMALFSGNDPYLAALDDSLASSDIAAEIEIGLHEIPLSLIVGTRTKGRQSAFSANFMPLLAPDSEFAIKWQSLFNSQIEEGLRDPIKCYEYLNHFYVEEGNKRVSVMKYLGAYSIHANVIRILPKRTDDLRIRIYYEFLDFFNVTGLFDVVFSREGSYGELAACLGQNLTDPWPKTLLEDFRMGFNTFSKIYEDRGGSRLSGTVYDAFLVYLGVYSLSSLLTDGAGVIHKRLGRLWREFSARTSAETVTIADSPETIEMDSDTTEAPASGLLRLFGAHTETAPLRVAFIFEKNAQTSTWVYGHELGRLDVSHRLGSSVETIPFEDCDTAEKVDRAIEAALADECEVIFTTSPAMMPSTRKAAIDNPKVRFLNCSVNLPVGSVRTYYSRMYEAKFLMGVLAASLSSNHRVGYNADYPLYGTISNINAFAAGAAMVDPKCRVELTWSGLSNSLPESEAFSPEVRIISGADFIRPEDPVPRYGLYRVEDDGRCTILASPIHEWGRYYELILTSILNESYDSAAAKRGSSLNYWFGMPESVINVILSGNLSYNTKKLIQAFRSSILTGSFLPFDGELRSQSGIVKAETDPRLTYGEIITMNWLFENVDGRIPSANEIKESAQRTMAVAGVNEAAAQAARAAARTGSAGSLVRVPVGRSPEESAAAAKAARLEADRLAAAAVARAKAAEASAAQAAAAAQAEAAEARAKAQEEAVRARASAEAETARVRAEAEAETAKIRAEAEAEAARAKAAAEEKAAKARAEAEETAKNAEAEAARARAEAEETAKNAEAEAARARAEAEETAKNAEAEAARARAEAEAEAARARAEAEAETARARAEAEAETARARAEAEEAAETAKKATAMARKAVRIITETRIEASAASALAKEAQVKAQKAVAEAAAARLDKADSEAAADAALARVRFDKAAGEAAQDAPLE